MNKFGVGVRNRLVVESVYLKKLLLYWGWLSWDVLRAQWFGKRRGEDKGEERLERLADQSI